MLQHAAGFVLVALCWGATNPLIKRGSRGLERVEPHPLLGRTCAELAYLLTRWQASFVPFPFYFHPPFLRSSRNEWIDSPGTFSLARSPSPAPCSSPQYVVPLLLNLAGSVVYYHTLAEAGGSCSRPRSLRLPSAFRKLRLRSRVPVPGSRAKTNLSLAVPIANSLTFIFTTLTGALLGEKVGGTGVQEGNLLQLSSVSGLFPDADGKKCPEAVRSRDPVPNVPLVYITRGPLNSARATVNAGDPGGRRAERALCHGGDFCQRRRFLYAAGKFWNVKNRTLPPSRGLRNAVSPGCSILAAAASSRSTPKCLLRAPCLRPLVCMGEIREL
ncbi:MAG: hypothetical protein BJ554DRAFT_5114 [Olpidium bornovanus]|uniref:Transmembrane protein 234 n=1 Tax=Olpidium bornovanus TaxID=278681 RepID=A0A8H8DEP6_9FUNG|nr:MAG: hypothetical protein BJ554DRAFT_5114 [Olpidium bornovanus]